MICRAVFVNVCTVHSCNLETCGVNKWGEGGLPVFLTSLKITTVDYTLYSFTLFKYFTVTTKWFPCGGMFENGHGLPVNTPFCICTGFAELSWAAWVTLTRVSREGQGKTYSSRRNREVPKNNVLKTLLKPVHYDRIIFKHILNGLISVWPGLGCLRIFSIGGLI